MGGLAPRFNSQLVSQFPGCRKVVAMTQDVPQRVRQSVGIATPDGLEIQFGRPLAHLAVPENFGASHEQ
ncbi:Uncharacterised protein [Achromobacter denitrificans]|nr:hypothetical protein LMG1231_00632 [Achromobacter denitrificans]SUU20449.1 Uncharacterised protein [Achromobacter denitrificans]